jgi:hypothetical protein
MSENFTVSTNGVYPNETYTAYVSTQFVDIKGVNQTLTDSKSALPVRSFLRYQKKPTNEIINYLDSPYYNDLFTFKNCTYNLNLDQTYSGDNFIGKIPTIKFSSNPTITVNISALRQTYKTPSEFYLFYYTITGATQNYNTPMDSYGYMIYPQKITLKATGLTKNITTGWWSLSTNIKKINSVTKYLSSGDIEADATNFHKNYYLKNTNNFLIFDDLPSFVTPPLVLNITPLLSANRNIVNKSLIGYSSVNNPASAKFILESSSENYINLDSTDLNYYIKYASPNGLLGYFVGQSNSDVYTYKNFQNFNTSHIICYNPVASGNKQLFKIAQYKSNTAAYLGDSTNCILSAIINFDDNTLLYYANTATYHLSSANFDIPFAISYKVDSPYLLTGETVKSTLYSIELKRNTPNPNTWKTLIYGNSIDTASYNNNILIFNTKYPPHFYSYKIDLRDGSNKYYDSNKLNFNLVSELAEKVPNTTYAIVETKIKSDFNSTEYSFDNTNTFPNDLIKYTFYNITSGVYDDLKITYGPNVGNTNYTIVGETYSTTKYLSGAYGAWIPILSGKDLKIDYVGAKFGKANLTLRATISTFAGEMDAFEATNITLAEDIGVNPIVLNILDEKSNIIYIDSSVNSITSQWPGRCLSGVSGAYISWNITPYNPNITIFAVNSALNYIQTITPNVAYLWDSNTYTVCVSGYGDQRGYTTSIYLSSQFYDEVSKTVIPNKSLFDYFHENRFVITPEIELNNLEKTRKIKLIAQVPYGKTLYNMPSSTPIYWTWQYGSDLNPITQPIIALSGNSNDIYSYATNQLATNVSAMKFEITPDISSRVNYHDITIKLYSDIRNPSITGSYIFTVDDFPSADIFNADFTTTYYDYPLTVIADTRVGKNTITRSSDKDKKFKFKANTDVLSKIVYDPYSLYWTLSNKSISLISRDKDFSYDLTSYPELLTTVTLNLTGAYAPGWINAHNISSTTYIYLLPPSEFNKTFKFRAFPEFAWLNSPYLTLLNSNNYTLIGSATANYGNTKTKSIAFWLSANKDYFTKYNYQSLSNKTIIQTKNYYDLMDIPYDNNNVYSNGLPISLTAYNDTYYPLINGISYKEPNDGNMETYYFNNFTKTLDVVDIDNDKFRLTPKVLPYNDLSLTFNIKNPNSTLNLDNAGERLISINQTLTTSPLNSPAIAIDGAITYVLSSKYWSASANVPIADGTYDLFTLKIGDPYVTLYTGELGIENFVLYNVANITQQIPQSTFNNVTYTKNKDLWEVVNL